MDIFKVYIKGLYMIKVKYAPCNAKCLHACAQFFFQKKKNFDIRHFMQK